MKLEFDFLILFISQFELKIDENFLIKKFYFIKIWFE